MALKNCTRDDIGKIERKEGGEREGARVGQRREGEIIRKFE